MDDFRKNLYNVMMLLVMIMIYIPSLSFSSSIGSIFTNQKVEMAPGEERLFKVSMFNLNTQSPVEIEFKLLTPIYYSSYGKDLEVYVIDKDYNVLDRLIMHELEQTTTPSSEFEWILNPDGKTYVRTYPFYIYVKVLNKPTFARNHYKVVISARTKPETISASVAQSVSQERQFVIDLTITGLLESNKVSGTASSAVTNTVSETSLNYNSNEEDSLKINNKIIAKNPDITEDYFDNNNEDNVNKEDNYIYESFDKEKNNYSTNASKSNVSGNLITGKSIDVVKQHPFAWSTIIIMVLGTLILIYLWFR